MSAGLAAGSRPSRALLTRPPRAPLYHPAFPLLHTDCDAAWVRHSAVVKSLLQGSHPKLIQVQVVQGRLWGQSGQG